MKKKKKMGLFDHNQKRFKKQNRGSILALSLSAVGILLFFSVAKTLPISNRFLHALFPKSSLFAAGSVTITGIATDNSSVKIDFQPVPGAKDYRVYDVSAPTKVKYAGIRHIELVPPFVWQCGNCHLAMQADGVNPVVPLAFVTTGNGPQTIDIPSPEVEWNSAYDHQPHTLVVQALDSLGPVPSSSLYDYNNSPLFGPLQPGQMLGMNQGITPDGNTSTNGQGPYTNNPHVIAQSDPFIVQTSSSIVPVPSRQDASQVFLDTFEQSEAKTIKQTLYNPDNATYSMNAGTPLEWSIQYEAADVKNSMPFISAAHFMDMLFDSATPPASPLHNGHGTMAMSPKQTIDFSNGKIAHITMEADAHMSGRRWLSMILAPADDPLTQFDNDFVSTNPMNKTSRAVDMQFTPSQDTLTIDHSQNNVEGLWGAAGQGTYGGYNSSDLSGNGIAFDNKSRFDFFISQTHAALFQDGELIQQSDIPGGTPFTQAKVYFVHYVYHTDQEENSSEGDLIKGACYPMNAFWFNDPQKGTVVGSADGQSACGVAYAPGFGFRYSDERHWDNMGFEVLPASASSANDFSSFSSIVQPPALVAPVFASGVPTQQVSPTDTPMPSMGMSPTVTPSVTLTPTPTPTVVPTLTPTPTRRPTPTPVSSGGGVLGNKIVGSKRDDGDSNYINGSKFKTGRLAGTVVSMSAYVANVSAAPNNQFQFGIYADSNGQPGNLVAFSGTGVLNANAWNTLAITATLQPNTNYWLVYNTNGTDSTVNNMKYTNGGTDSFSTDSVAFNSWPSQFGPATIGNIKFSIYATYQ